jgi:drug/metabolite transporter (DMT)-like permease
LPSLNAVAWVALCLIWGSTWLAIKIGLDDLPPISYAWIRFAIASAILYVVLLVRRIPFPKSSAEWRLLAVTGLLQFSFNYSLVFWAEQHIASGLAAVMQANISVFGLVLAWIFLPHERITANKIIAVGLGVLGVVVVFSDQLRVQSALAFWGCLAVFVSAFTASLASILVKARGTAMHPAMLTFGQMVCGLPALVLYGVVVEGYPWDFDWTWSATWSVLYLAIPGTIVAFSLYYWLLSRVESTTAMAISIVTPVVAVLLGWLIRNEQLPARTAIGAGLIMASIMLIVLGRNARWPGVLSTYRPPS